VLALKILSTGLVAVDAIGLFSKLAAGLLPAESVSKDLAHR
jgi:hypothetical protein